MHNVVGFLDEHYLRLSAKLTLRGALSSSSSGGTPSGEHSRLHNWTPFGTILCAKPRRVETKVGRLQVRLDGTEPGSTWLASPAAPVGWKTVDGCLKGTGMILWWIRGALCHGINGTMVNPAVLRLVSSQFRLSVICLSVMLVRLKQNSSSSTAKQMNRQYQGGRWTKRK